MLFLPCLKKSGCQILAGSHGKSHGGKSSASWRSSCPQVTVILEGSRVGERDTLAQRVPQRRARGEARE